jgi:2-polyprenyl-6-methoxyphenol hydroxylase-like FAD-dependent oxidoreductase
VRFEDPGIGATEDGQVLLDGADPVIANVVVGADGIHSAVRRSLFGEEPLRYGGHRAWRAGTHSDDELVRDRFVEVWGVGSGFGFGPAGPGRKGLRAYERRRVRRADAAVRASRRAGRAAEVRSPIGARVRDAIMKALPDRLTLAQQRRIAEFRP